VDMVVFLLASMGCCRHGGGGRISTVWSMVIAMDDRSAITRKMSKIVSFVFCLSVCVLSLSS
jgi:hypothetical protein